MSLLQAQYISKEIVVRKIITISRFTVGEVKIHMLLIIEGIGEDLLREGI